VYFLSPPSLAPIATLHQASAQCRPSAAHRTAGQQRLVEEVRQAAAHQTAEQEVLQAFFPKFKQKWIFLMTKFYLLYNLFYHFVPF
jgi:hypothetical protein